ncbi:oxamate carbamoyltransferase subunit AllG family protein, partial [Klebsiella pneumoniae]
MDAAHGIEYSTVVTTMARNGVEFGLRISGLPGQWFTGPAQQVIGPMFAGYKLEDSGRDIGDSAITETYGVGGFAMATAPAIVSLVGGTVD